MKKCELCNKVARMYCNSDEASLCWDCDFSVHTANFLVSKHTRTLLCHACQSPTSWTGSGPKLGPTVSVCDKCVDPRKGKIEDEENGDGENQVVPLSPPPSFASTSSSSEESSTSSTRDGFSGSSFGFFKAKTTVQKFQDMELWKGWKRRTVSKTSDRGRGDSKKLKKTAWRGVPGGIIIMFRVLN